MSLCKTTPLSAKRVLFLARHAMLRLHVVEGACGGLPLRLLVADDGSTLSYIRRLAFPQGSTVQDKSRISAFDAPRLATSSADIVVVGANCLLRNRYAEQGFHVVPKWICPFLPMPEGPDAIIAGLSPNARKDIKRNVRLALEKGFSYETTDDPSWFDTFYNDVYLRYGKSRYGELAQVDGYRRVKWAYDRGVGLIVTLENEPVMAGIVFTEDSTMRARYMGIYPGKEEAAFGGATTLMYYFSLELAHKWGCTAVNLGSSRPFLSDGVLKFKMKWQPGVLPDDRSTAFFAIAAPEMSQPAKNFLTANPFFEAVGDEFRLHKPCFTTSQDPPGESILASG